MKLFRWQTGRGLSQEPYYKMLLFQVYKMDCYILKYPLGSGIDWHCDPVTGHAHWRFNWTFWAAKAGGMCQAIYPVTWAWISKNKKMRAYLFRPDENMHRVTRITNGTRLVLSIGVAIKKK